LRGLLKIMSRIGRRPVRIVSGVELNIEEEKVTVKGPKGEMAIEKPRNILVEVKDGFVFVKPNEVTNLIKPTWGLVRSRINSAIIGVSEGFKKTLKLVGLGYRVTKKGEGITLAIGFSHPVDFAATEGIKFEVDGNDTVMVSGVDKEKVGLISAQIRAVRPPEPYKGKGIMFLGEKIRRKAGKSGKVGAGVTGGAVGGAGGAKK